MLTDNRVPRDDDLDQADDDLARAARAAAALSNTAEATARTNDAVRSLARQLDGDPVRLARCVRGCRRRAEGSTDAAAHALWRRAERLVGNALTLVEALGADDGPAAGTGT